MANIFYVATIFSRSKYAHFAGHKGFELDLCHGDITLRIKHSPGRIPEEVRPKLTKAAPFLQPKDDETFEEIPVAVFEGIKQ